MLTNQRRHGRRGALRDGRLYGRIGFWSIVPVWIAYFTDVDRRGPGEAEHNAVDPRVIRLEGGVQSEQTTGLEEAAVKRVAVVRPLALVHAQCHAWNRQQRQVRA